LWCIKFGGVWRAAMTDVGGALGVFKTLRSRKLTNFSIGALYDARLHFRPTCRRVI
jgi:hypothetical protein